MSSSWSLSLTRGPRKANRRRGLLRPLLAGALALTPWCPDYTPPLAPVIRVDIPARHSWPHPRAACCAWTNDREKAVLFLSLLSKIHCQSSEIAKPMFLKINNQKAKLIRLNADSQNRSGKHGPGAACMSSRLLWFEDVQLEDFISKLRGIKPKTKYKVILLNFCQLLKIDLSFLKGQFLCFDSFIYTFVHRLTIWAKSFSLSFQQLFCEPKNCRAHLFICPVVWIYRSENLQVVFLPKLRFTNAMFEKFCSFFFFFALSLELLEILNATWQSSACSSLSGSGKALHGCRCSVVLLPRVQQGDRSTSPPPHPGDSSNPSGQRRDRRRVLFQPERGQTVLEYTDRSLFLL